MQQSPKYCSHYSREKNPSRKSLPQGLNIRQMYKLYETFCEEKKVVPEKASFYRHVFNTCKNFSFKRPKTDTCDICDKYTSKIDHGTEEEEEVAKMKRNCAEQKLLAWPKIQQVKLRMTVILLSALIYKKQCQLTPNLTNQKAYYFRQLWTYNLSIHSLMTNTANMFM